jgi:acyl-CoA thioesterase-2
MGETSRQWTRGPRPSIPEVLSLDRTGDFSFRGGLRGRAPARTFGGEVAGQAVLAASRTVAGRDIHAAHLNFLRPGNTARPVDLLVEPTRDGGSFSARRVQAVQDGRVILTMTASFQDAEQGLEHQVPVMDVSSPSETPTPGEMFADDVENLAWTGWLTEALDLDVRFPDLPVRAAAARGLRVAPRQRMWLRARQPVGSDRADQAAALAYLSDVLILSAALGPHQLTFQGDQVQFATIDHAIWFHAPLPVDEWFLYEQESRWAAGARALCRGEIFDLQGRLCATTMQEGLVRARR